MAIVERHVDPLERHRPAGEQLFERTLKKLGLKNTLNIENLWREVPGGPIIAPFIITAANFYFDRAFPPSTTVETADKARTMYRKLVENSATPEIFFLGQEYFTLIHDLLSRKAPPAESYRVLFSFFDRRDLLQQNSSAEEYIASCLQQAGIQPDKKEIDDLIYKIGPDFHKGYLPRLPAKMEVMDLNPNDFNDPYFKELATACLQTVTADYHAIKARLAAIPHPDRRKRIPLLLKDYLDTLKQLQGYFAQHNSEWLDTRQRNPVILVVGPGKGEELKFLTNQGWNVIVADMLPDTILEEMIKTSYQEMGSSSPEIYTKANFSAQEYLSRMKESTRQVAGSAYLLGGKNLDTDQLEEIPDGAVDAAGTSYTPHHSQNIPKWLSEIWRVVHPIPNHPYQKAVVVNDGLPSIEHFVRQILPMICLTGEFTTGQDAFISHARGIPPEVWPLIFKKLPGFWQAEEIGPEIRNRFGTIIMRTQFRITGFNPKILASERGTNSPQTNINQ